MLAMLALLAAAALPIQVGPHPVGFRVIAGQDSARSHAGSIRPLRLFVWYPAATAGAPMPFRGYVEAEGRGVADFDRRAAELAARELTPGEIAGLLERSTRAARDATPASGPFPVALLGGGLNGTAYLHTELGEALASHGYVAVALSSHGLRPDERLAFDLHGVELLEHDMERALERLAREPVADTSRLGLVGWSVGGVALALLETRNDRVDAFVALDSGVGYAYGRTLLDQWPFGERRPLATPFLQIDALGPARYFVERDETFLASRPRAMHLASRALRHADMTSLGALMAQGRPDGREVAQAYAAVVETTRRFLDAHVRADPDGAAFLDRGPAANGFAPDALAAVERDPSAAATGGLGRIAFPVTGSAACAQGFRDGMLALHSFQYVQAHARFESTLRADPGCAMAAWGDAMAYDHPIWAERDVVKARAALSRISSEEALTAKERALVAAARALFEAPDQRRGHEAWLGAMARLAAEHPGDDEVALQHALALIAVHGYDRTRQRGQSQAGAIALEVLRRRPDHPGAAHYAIHAFDNPEHAILALPAARIYAKIAPAAGHALHMPSHVFTKLGMWSEVVPSNEQAWAASQAAARELGAGPDRWDWHSYSWLVAARLELGQVESARALVEAGAALLARHDSPEMRTAYADIVKNYVAQTGRTAEAEALAAPLLRPVRGEGQPDQPVDCAQHAPGGGAGERPPLALLARLAAQSMRAEAALSAGDPDKAEARARDISAVVEQMGPWLKAGRRLSSATIATAYVSEVEARARLLRARSSENVTAALAAIERSVEVTDGLPIAGPAFTLTARERKAAALLAAGQPVQALAEYERVVEARPNRALSLLGAARAARAAGDGERARAHYAALAELWKDADLELPALTEVRAGSAPARKARDASFDTGGARGRCIPDGAEEHPRSGWMEPTLGLEPRTC